MGLLANTSQLKDWVSNELLDTEYTVYLVIIGTCFTLCGIVANVLNIVVFIKQGLNDTVNIGLFGLALSDQCSLITLEAVFSFRNRLIPNPFPVMANEVQYLIASWPHICFAKITSIITVYITLERCLCVVIPLKVKIFITPRVTTCVVVGIYLFTIVTVIPEYFICYLGWKFIPEQNRSLLGLIFFPEKDEFATIIFNVSVGSHFASFTALVICSALLVVKLKEKTKWRQSISTSGGGSSTKEANVKESRTAKMITFIACIYCICSLPLLMYFVALTVVPGFAGFGTYNNTQFQVWSFSAVCDSINSSVNICIYYRMSTKFRTTFLAVICKHQIINSRGGVSNTKQHS